MNRISRFTLINGAGTRVSDKNETDDEIVDALKNKFGDSLVSVEISGRIISI
jgi:ornithine cyclodeaminase/alanine dehydrogenase-like protein (mu-crystallin family)